MQTIYYNDAKNNNLEVLDSFKTGAWIHVEGPDEGALASLASEFKLDDSLLFDAMDPYESPRIEREGEHSYIFTRFCDMKSGQITTLPMLIILGKDVIITISSQQFPRLHYFIDQRIEFLTTQRTQLLLNIMSEINTTYRSELNRISRTILGIRSQLNKASIDNQDFVRMIDIEEDLNEFLAALDPQHAVLRQLLAGKFIKLYEDDKDLIEDLSLGTTELIELSSSRLKNIVNIREAYSTITANNLNKVFKLMTSITILMGIFTLITGIYSMNIALPAAHNPNAFWIILSITAGFIGLATWFFKRNKWL